MMDDYSHIFMLESENQALRDEITMWRYRITVEDRLLHYIPAAVIDECVAVLDHGEVKHPRDQWKTILPHVHEAAADAHLHELWKGREREQESGCYHLAHAIVRYMMALAQYMGAVPMVHKEEV